MTPTDAAPGAGAASSINKKILVIDDNPIIQRALQMALQEKGYTVVIAGEIAAALKVVREQRPDVILLDLNFPPDNSLVGYSLRDGFTVLGWLRHLDEVKGTPIIVVSGDAPEKSKAQALAAGADAYFHKPINNEELAATITALIARKKS
jgi:DNA-binding response OmpR family regulator